jgi:hypothetical protein
MNHEIKPPTVEEMIDAWKQSDLVNEKTGLKKKKRNRRKSKAFITGILSIALILIGTSTYFAYPYVQQQINYQERVAKALKSAGANFVNSIFPEQENGATLPGDSGKAKNIKGTVQLQHAVINQEDYSQKLNADTLNYDITMVLPQRKADATIEAGMANETTMDQVHFYFDHNVLYLNSDTLMNNPYQISLDAMDSTLNEIKEEDITEYQSVLRTILMHILTGYNTIIDHCSISHYSADTNQMSIPSDVTGYLIEISPEAMIAGADVAIDAIYDDNSLNSYRTLFATYSGYSRNELKEDAKKYLSSLGMVKMVVALDHNNKAQAVYIDLNNPVYHLDGASHCLITLQGKKVSMEFSMNGKMKEEQIELSLIADMTFTADVNLPVKSSAYDRSIDLSKMTQKEKDKIWTRLVR